MTYRFDIYHYGPFCDELQKDMEWLMADGVVEDVSKEDRYSNYAPGPAADEIFASHGDIVTELRNQVSGIVSALAPMRPEELELFATLDYLYRKQVASSGSGPWKDSVIARFCEVKGTKFAMTTVEAAYDAMAKSGIFEA